MEFRVKTKNTNQWATEALDYAESFIGRTPSEAEMKSLQEIYQRQIRTLNQRADNLERAEIRQRGRVVPEERRIKFTSEKRFYGSFLRYAEEIGTTSGKKSKSTGTRLSQSTKGLDAKELINRIRKMTNLLTLETSTVQGIRESISKTAKELAKRYSTSLESLDDLFKLLKDTALNKAISQAGSDEVFNAITEGLNEGLDYNELRAIVEKNLNGDRLNVKNLMEDIIDASIDKQFKEAEVTDFNFL